MKKKICRKLFSTENKVVDKDGNSSLDEGPCNENSSEKALIVVNPNLVSSISDTIYSKLASASKHSRDNIQLSDISNKSDSLLSYSKVCLEVVPEIVCDKNIVEASYGEVKVVRAEGATLRDNYDIDDSNIICV